MAATIASTSVHQFSTPIFLKLAEDNFLLWKQQVLATLDGLLLSKYLDGSQQPPRLLPLTEGKPSEINPDFLFYRQQDNLIVAWMLASMSNPFLTKMVGLQSAPEIWKTLQTHFTSNMRAQINKFRLRLKTPKQDCSVSAYLLEIKTAVDSLAAIGAPVSIEDQIEAILDGLSEDYDSFVTSIMSRSEPYTINEIEALLLAQEERLAKPRSVDPLPYSPAAAIATWRPSHARHGKQNPRFSSSRGGRSHSCSSYSTGSHSSVRAPFTPTQSSNSWSMAPITCQICKKTGHSVEHCWHRYDQSASQSPSAHFSQLSISENASSTASLLGAPSSVDDPLWYPDSGATHHITNNSSVYSDKQPYDGTDLVKMGNGKGLFISHIGSANFRPSTSNKPLFLTDLLHVPAITKNLLSVSKFCRDNNAIFEFHSNNCYVLDQETKRVLLQGYLKDGLYIFPALHSLPSFSVHSMSFIAEPISINQWHERSGH